MASLKLRVDPDAAIPLWTQISQQLTWLIVSGHLAEGDRLPAVRALADELDINLHTVRAAYQELVGMGLVSSQRGRGTTVQLFDRRRVAAGTPALPTFTIGVILAEYDPFYGPLLTGVEEVAAADSSLLFVANAHDTPAVRAAYLDQFVAKGTDGVIVVSASPPEEGTDESLVGPDLPPVVYADSPQFPDPAVCFDFEGGVAALTEHLIEHGHRRIGFVSPPEHWNNVTEMRRGLDRARAGAGLEARTPELHAVAPNYFLPSGEAAAAEMLAAPLPPTAIIAGGNDLAIGVMRAVETRGLHVGSDVAVVGVGDIDTAALVRPPLTTLALPARDMGARAMAMLSALIAGDPVDEPHVTLETELRVRESCGCADP